MRRADEALGARCWGVSNVPVRAVCPVLVLCQARRSAWLKRCCSDSGHGCFDAARIATAMAVGSLLNTRSSCAAI